ncbi:hypothetical protein MXB_4493 [Myxobolus squamalis]|nr:hypothetical protein MXB_4493 [Myxobolus squamalis]
MGLVNGLKKVKKIILWGCQNDLELIEKYEPLIEYFEIKKIYAYIEFNEEITGADFNRFIKTNSFKLYEIDDIVVPHTKFLDPNKLLESLLKYQKVEIKHPISNEPDEDGWITVGGKDKLTSLPFKQKPEPKNKNEDDSLCIYAFRRRQIQEEKISLLRRKFEEDKQKVALMRTKPRAPKQ